MYNIDEKYVVLVKDISCPGCGQKYGHHNTKVDINSEECSKCAKDLGYKDVELVKSDKFIEEFLEIKPLF